MGDKIYVYIGGRIAAIRKMQKLTQSDLAKMIGMAPSTVSHWEIASVQIPVAMIYAVAQVLHISVSDLLPPETWPTDPSRIVVDEHMSSIVAAYQSNEKLRWAIDALLHAADNT